MDESTAYEPARNGRRGTRATPISLVTMAAVALCVVVLGAVIVGVVRNGPAAAEPLVWPLIAALLLNLAVMVAGRRRHRNVTRQLRLQLDSTEGARRLSPKDPLTGFLNRRALVEEGTTMLQEAAQRQLAVAMLMIDLDRFKTINDLHGHGTGDVLLARVAAEISNELPPVSLAARVGGDEFACLFVFNPADPNTVQRVAERLVSRLTRPLDLGGTSLHVSASIGIAHSDQERTTVEALIRASDIAMYAAKEAGRNRFSWFDPDMARALHARHELETALRAAIPAGQIVPHFEQQMDLNTGQLLGFEVLARWNHPLHGQISPDRFIPIAEQTGMIADLSQTLMRQAFLAARDWDPALTISINVSAVQLRDAWLPQKIIKLLLETGFPAHRLEIEITERALFENLALAQSIIGSLKNQGISVALDDFGTGYSSLGHLRAMPFDRIKIERSFVQVIAEDQDSAALVGAVASVGASLNLPVTAEGIEDLATEARMRALGCARGQGYLYGRPADAANTRRLLAERRLLGAGSAASDAERRLAG
ncbi:putative bifunctional diguanylate cyclase/phosphodiesterase [Sphingomonas mucosissima]|uniref:Phytochrome-like protein cph2 n=1 Tax=Sphingomonas mucosissima TaxID=370959 RepID=A0A245ZTJ5_9SPHN|nr:EAL domain-containing protein [Sphingomonas mucosissima]OWK33030.1 phytochrome-like protein cph2 [Sphingomonas mucosissima]